MVGYAVKVLNNQYSKMNELYGLYLDKEKKDHIVQTLDRIASEKWNFETRIIKEARKFNTYYAE
jgi:hypothetical protein